MPSKAFRKEPLSLHNHPLHLHLRIVGPPLLCQALAALIREAEWLHVEIELCTFSKTVFETISKQSGPVIPHGCGCETFVAGNGKPNPKVDVLCGEASETARTKCAVAATILLAVSCDGADVKAIREWMHPLCRHDAATLWPHRTILLSPGGNPADVPNEWEARASGADACFDLGGAFSLDQLQEAILGVPVVTAGSRANETQSSDVTVEELRDRPSQETSWKGGKAHFPPIAQAPATAGGDHASVSEVKHVQVRRSLLTNREREIVSLVATNLTNQDIADRLFISLPTVKSHLQNAFSKLGIRKRKELRDL